MMLLAHLGQVLLLVGTLVAAVNHHDMAALVLFIGTITASSLIGLYNACKDK